MGILNNPAILRIRVPFQDFQPMEILNLELLAFTPNLTIFSALLKSSKRFD